MGLTFCILIVYGGMMCAVRFCWRQSYVLAQRDKEYEGIVVAHSTRTIDRVIIYISGDESIYVLAAVWFHCVKRQTHDIGIEALCCRWTDIAID